MTSLSYAWLPDHHLSAAASLAHADEVIAQVADILFEYQTRPDGIIALREVPMMSHSQTVVTGLNPIPRKVPLLVADAMVTMRNAIEHTLFTEVEHREGALGETAAKLVEMPARQTYEDFQKWVKVRAKNGPSSLQRGSDLLRRIDGLQPFHRRRDPQNHPLALLSLHTNHSKHRAPAITAVGLAGIHREDGTPPSMADFERRPETPVQVGDVIAETPRGVQVPVTLFPTIGINRPGTEHWPVLIKELDVLFTWVRTQAIPRLITGDDPPGPALPPRYEISVGHEDERRALAEGAVLSAAEAHDHRLVAAMARRDMTETLSQLGDAPSAEQISAWLESLSDQEMLRQMRKLQATGTYEPDIVLSNYAILEAMRNDARRFAGLEPRADGI